MIDFSRSTFTWKNHPWQPDPHYKYAGGFVGVPGQVYHVRFNLEAACRVRDESTGTVSEMFVGAPCRTEYTIANRNLFQVPSSEFRMAFSRESKLNIASRPSDEREESSITRLDEAWADHKIDIRSFGDSREASDAREVIESTLSGDLLNARTEYRDVDHNIAVTLEYPVNLINLNEADDEFQVCTGPVIVPDLATWDGAEVSRVFLAHAALSAFDHVEFILRREVAASESEKEWLDMLRGRDRLELLDPDNPPPGFPPDKPDPTVYNEVWELEAVNTLLRVDNP